MGLDIDWQMERIDRTSRFPLYSQLYDILRGNITRRKWRPGDMIPPESELIERYQVSRTTVRQVLDMLAGEGLIFRQQGRGTYVAHQTVEQGLVRIVSFTDDMQQRGFTPGTQVLFSGLVNAPKDIADRLGILPGEELARLERLRLADEEPMSVEESYLVHRHCPGILEGDYSENPLRVALTDAYGIRWLHAKQSIRAILTPQRLAPLLMTGPGAPMLLIERVSFSQNNIPIEFLRIHYRADRYALYGELNR
jgi:GntR family transcriptional regulator